MKHFIYSLFALALCATVGCGEDPIDENPQKPNESTPAPTVVLAKGEATASTLTFTATLTDAEEAAYVVLEDGATLPALEDILKDGVALDVKATEAQTVTVEGLTPATKYMVVAAAKNVTATVGSNTVYMSTLELGKLTLTAEVVQKDHEKMHFRVKAENAEKIAYVVMAASMKAPEMSYVLQSGEEIAVDNRESIEVAELTCDTEYVLYVAAEGNEQSLMETVTFKTDDDPAKVLRHEYTRAIGTVSKYSPSYFIMFSYEDAAEEDNFAYNDKTLSLDFYNDSGKDYLPAGTYTVRSSMESGSVDSSRYSNYGYTNGVLLNSGEVVVEIDPETKAYTFKADLYLKDGRHLVATYTGDVDGMPVIDIVNVDTDFTKASATTADEGVNWTLNLEDEIGNKATINLMNAFKAPYIVGNSYTISTSTGQMAVRPLALEPGQFDAATSTFTVAGEEAKPLLTGTLTVSVDWENKKYMMSLYGTLDGNYNIDTEFIGAIDGVSLEPVEEIVDVVLTKATGDTYDDGKSWTLKFTDEADGVINHNLTLYVACPAMEYMPAGVYELNTDADADGCRITSDGTVLRVAGEGTYDAVDARATVTVNMENKTYTLDITYKVHDGRIFKFAYTGEISGITIVEPEVPADTITWTSFVAEKWSSYSPNWDLSFEDENKEYSVVLNLVAADDSLNYISTGEYTIDNGGIRNNYSTFNNKSGAFKEVTLKMTYHEDTKTYNVEFDLILNNGNNYTGTYSGAIEGSPAE